MELESFPAQFGVIKQIHHISHHTIVEYFARYKGELRTDAPVFMAWGLKEGGGIAATPYYRSYSTFDEALFDSIALRNGATSAEAYCAKKVLSLGLGRV